MHPVTMLCLAVVAVIAYAVYANSTYREAVGCPSVWSGIPCEVETSRKAKAEVCARNYGVTQRPAYCD